MLLFKLLLVIVGYVETGLMFECAVNADQNGHFKLYV